MQHLATIGIASSLAMGMVGFGCAPETDDFELDDAGAPDVRPELSEIHPDVTPTDSLLEDALEGESDEGAVLEVVDEVPADASSDAVCEELVPAAIDALQGTGSFLPGMDDDHFCARGSVTYTIDDIPADEIASILAAPETEDTYFLAFALSNTRNRNWAASQIKRRTDSSDAEIIVKTSGGSCIACAACCQCALGPTGDIFCGSEIARHASPSYTAGVRYTIRWDSDARLLCFQKGTTAEACTRFDLPMAFAFNRYCGGAGCNMIHWAAPRWWTAGTVAFQGFVCEQTVTTAPGSCR